MLKMYLHTIDVYVCIRYAKSMKKRMKKKFKDEIHLILNSAEQRAKIKFI